MSKRQIWPRSGPGQCAHYARGGSVKYTRKKKGWVQKKRFSITSNERRVLNILTQVNWVDSGRDAPRHIWRRQMVPERNVCTRGEMVLLDAGQRGPQSSEKYLKVIGDVQHMLLYPTLDRHHSIYVRNVASLPRHKKITELIQISYQKQNETTPKGNWHH